MNQRKTFAIISHPDAGKTTITEKLLLFGGAIQTAGTIRARKSSRHATSDWMEIEKQRGISVTSSVMQFNYNDHTINLLDTPGHQDFSEDTYRVLTAVDSSLMLIDGVKGVEEQTIKLLEVCRMRHTPVMTFMNKFDRACKDPFELLDEVEKILKIECSPITWPIGSGKEFKGVYDRLAKNIKIFTPGKPQADFTIIEINDLASQQLNKLVGDELAQQLCDDLELLEASAPFSPEEYICGKQTPVFFGSAVNNFGIQEFLKHFLQYAPGPCTCKAQERSVQPDEEKFTAFVFKIQANMDPGHRDRIAFARICSGKFTKGMTIYHSRLQRKLKINNTLTFMAQERTNTETAYAGDILGFYDTGLYQIGDSLSEGEELHFQGIPNFAPEHFMKVILADPLKNKQLQKGLDQLCEEGAAQVFRTIYTNQLILGVVGPLQFEVIKFRLLQEYKVNGNFEPVPYTCARWYSTSDQQSLKKFEERYSSQIALDINQKKIFLANSNWDIDYALKKFEDIKFFQNSDHIH